LPTCGWCWLVVPFIQPQCTGDGAVLHYVSLAAAVLTQFSGAFFNAMLFGSCHRVAFCTAVRKFITRPRKKPQ